MGSVFSGGKTARRTCGRALTVPVGSSVTASVWTGEARLREQTSTDRGGFTQHGSLLARPACAPWWRGTLLHVAVPILPGRGERGWVPLPREGGSTPWRVVFWPLRLPPGIVVKSRFTFHGSKQVTRSLLTCKGQNSAVLAPGPVRASVGTHIGGYAGGHCT